jgi:hypothetical protein
MDITYKWVVHGVYALTKEGERDKVIKRIIYELEATDGTHSARVQCGSGWIDFVPASSENFIPFEDFTEEMIARWLDENVPDIENLKEKARIEVEDQYLQPLSIQKPPWLPRE